MGSWPSINSSRRESTRPHAHVKRSRQRGFALISALVLAFLYFGLMQLLLIDSSRSLHEAQRFKARIVAKTLAENGAEIAATNAVNQSSGGGTVSDAQGFCRGTLAPGSGVNTLVIRGEGETSGVVKQTATVELLVNRNGNQLNIAYAKHSQ